MPRTPSKWEELGLSLSSLFDMILRVIFSRGQISGGNIAVELAVPANTSSGRTFRLKAKGLPGKPAAGDLYVTLRIVLPDGKDAELEELMKKWRDEKPYDPRSGMG